MQIYFGKSDICLVPHIKSDHTDSTIPHKIFQYMYAGKPMLVSNCEPLQRIVNESNTGEVYVFDDPKDFAKKLAIIANNNDYFSDEFMKRSQKLVLNSYNWKTDSQRLNKIYN
jgi:glycosyltransferase involved in cell wall biosynthesis